MSYFDWKSNSFFLNRDMKTGHASCHFDSGDGEIIAVRNRLHLLFNRPLFAAIYNRRTGIMELLLNHIISDATSIYILAADLHTFNHLD